MEIHRLVAFVVVATVIIIIIITINYGHRTNWLSSDGYDFHSGGVWFKPWPGQRFTD
jgi:hypothetical protein